MRAHERRGVQRANEAKIAISKSDATAFAPPWRQTACEKAGVTRYLEINCCLSPAGPRSAQKL